MSKSTRSFAQELNADRKLVLELSRIIVLARQSAIFQGLTQIMQKRLPDHDVLLVDDEMHSEEYGERACLVLLHHRQGHSLEESLRSCQQRFADVPVGIVVDGDDNDLTECEMAFGRRLVQGVLPLDLKLDVWMAAISLLVSGGEYYPPFIGDFRNRELASATNVPPEQQRVDGRRDLTTRELQILELVSQGYQNKLIADRMALSEHTVKVHVHNLITKLRVTNRTQAAAAFRLGKGGVTSGSSPREWRQ